jgi:hypothetical protein
MQRTFPISMALFITFTVVGGVLLLDEELTWGLPAGQPSSGSASRSSSSPRR